MGSCARLSVSWQLPASDTACERQIALSAAKAKPVRLKYRSLRFTIRCVGNCGRSSTQGDGCPVCAVGSHCGSVWYGPQQPGGTVQLHPGWKCGSEPGKGQDLHARPCNESGPQPHGEH